MYSFDPNVVIEHIKRNERVPEALLSSLMRALMDVLYLEDNLLELTAPLTVCGDIHGQLQDLFRLFSISGGIENNVYLFMGDYVDRGDYSVETFAYLAALKLLHPDRIYLLRGNHESRQVNQVYGFYNDVLLSYGHMGLWSLYNEVFDYLPIAATVNNQIFCVHGGLSPELNRIESLIGFNRCIEIPQTGGLLADMCWSDPDEVEDWTPNSRGVGWTFGKRQVEEFCHMNRLSFMARSHQLAMQGYQWLFDGRLITVWSAPNYMYRVGNIAAVMKIDNDLDVKLEVFDAHPESGVVKPGEVVLQYFS